MSIPLEQGLRLFHCELPDPQVENSMSIPLEQGLRLQTIRFLMPIANSMSIPLEQGLRPYSAT